MSEQNTGESFKESRVAIVDGDASYADAGAVHAHVARALEKLALPADHVRPGDRVVLSPAFSSLDMYGGYDDRGHAFTEAVRLLSAHPVSI